MRSLQLLVSTLALATAFVAPAGTRMTGMTSVAASSTALINIEMMAVANLAAAKRKAALALAARKKTAAVKAAAVKKAASAKAVATKKAAAAKAVAGKKKVVKTVVKKAAPRPVVKRVIKGSTSSSTASATAAAKKAARLKDQKVLAARRAEIPPLLAAPFGPPSGQRERASRAGPHAARETPC